MLIEFTVGNFRSFREAHSLSMVAASFQEHLDTNTFNPELSGGFGRLLRSAVVYGPNAGGKTNLLRALQVVQQFVVSSAATPRGTPPPYAPFKFSAATAEQPNEFKVAFVQNRTRYEYGFSIDAARVTREWLVEYVTQRGRAIFERTYRTDAKRYDWKFSSFLRGQRALWSESTREETLFLSTAVQLNSAQLLPVFEWFQRRLVVIAGATGLNPTLTLQTLRQQDGKASILPFLKEADLGITDLAMSREPITGSDPALSPNAVVIEQLPGDAMPHLVRVTFSHQTEDSNAAVGLDFSEESSGTQLLFRRSGAWLNVLSKGEILLVDEIDSSLHPLLTKYLVRKFHSSVSNPNNAQLVFSTHNTSLLDHDTFRRDQVWFVEKERAGNSRLYPLTDFKARNDEPLERWYMRGKYGAVPILDEMPTS